ncbi:hypothetical protein Tco_0190948 [Tanacetum coccineum]
MTGVMTEIILRECMEKAQAKSSLAKLKIDNNVKIELSKEHLKELRNNCYSGTEEEDVVDHIAKVRIKQKSQRNDQNGQIQTRERKSTQEARDSTAKGQKVKP